MPASVGMTREKGNVIPAKAGIDPHRNVRCPLARAYVPLRPPEADISDGKGRKMRLVFADCVSTILIWVERSFCGSVFTKTDLQLKMSNSSNEVAFQTQAEILCLSYIS
jgi:hypothetical protein